MLDIVDVLHKEDPWQGRDCGRPQCILCETKLKTGKHLSQDCTKRCIIYETWCMSCEEEDKRKIEEETEDETVEVMQESWKRSSRVTVLLIYSDFRYIVARLVWGGGVFTIW